MDLSNVTFASADERSLKHTRVINNKNILHCYHNNRGYCSFRDHCKYRHFKEICSMAVCRERECNKRHPVICRYRDDCKFYKTKSCAFKHINIETNKASKGFENKVEIFVKEIESLNSEIIQLRSDIDYKDKELHKSELEVQELTVNLTLLHKNKNSEKDIMEENDDLIKQVEMLKKENIALKMKLAKKDQIDDEKNALQLEEKYDTKITKEIYYEYASI